jgi:hypothetical protein
VLILQQQRGADARVRILTLALELGGDVCRQICGFGNVGVRKPPAQFKHPQSAPECRALLDRQSASGGHIESKVWAVHLEASAPCQPYSRKSTFVAAIEMFGQMIKQKNGARPGRH